MSMIRWSSSRIVLAEIDEGGSVDARYTYGLGRIAGGSCPDKGRRCTT